MQMMGLKVFFFFKKLLGSNKLVHDIFVIIQNCVCQQDTKSKQCKTKID